MSLIEILKATPIYDGDKYKWAAQICGHAGSLIKPIPKFISHIIVIHDIGDDPPEIEEGRAKILKLAFNDYGFGHPQGPQAAHVEKILSFEFLFGLQSPSNLLVTCTYGQSRSAAVALGVTSAYSGLIALGTDEWIHVNPKFSLIDIYRHLEGKIGPNWQLIDHFANWLGHPRAVALKAAAKHFNECD